MFKLMVNPVDWLFAPSVARATDSQIYSYQFCVV